MRVLVTGGTGFIGKRLVNSLVKEGDEVVVAARKPEGLPDSVRFVKADVLDKKGLDKAFKSVDIVYHLAVCLDENDPGMKDVNVSGTKNVAELCRQHRVKQLVYLSSSGVLGETSVPAMESFPYNPKTGYEKSKMEAELAIKNSGVNYTILRTTIVVGPNVIWAAILEAARRQYPVIGTGKNYFHLVYVDDIVSALLLVKNNGKSYGQVFHIAGADARTYEEVYRIICSELGVRVTDRHVPLYAARLASFLHAIKRKMQGKRPSLAKSRSSIDRLVRNRIISTEKARKVLGFVPAYDTKAAIKETVKYLRIGRLGYSDYDVAEISRIKGA